MVFFPPSFNASMSNGFTSEVAKATVVVRQCGGALGITVGIIGACVHVGINEGYVRDRKTRTAVKTTR